MPKYTREQIKEKYQTLPEDVKEAIYSADVTDTLFETGERYHLTVEKIGGLSSETVFLMLGLTHPKDFVSNVEQRLGVERKIASEITKELNEKIFSKIRESLKKIHKIESSTPEGEQTVVSSQSSATEKKPVIKQESGGEEKKDVPLPPISVPVSASAPTPALVPTPTLPKATPAPPKPTSDVEETKEEILKKIEKSDGVEVKIPEPPLKPLGFSSNLPVDEEKKQDGQRPKSGDYPIGDPYRESVE